DLYKIPEVVEMMAIPLDRALKFFENFIAQKGADPETRLERAWAYLQVGSIRHRLALLPDKKTGRSNPERRIEHNAKATEAHLRCVALLDALAMEHPDESRFRLEQAKAYRALAHAYQLQASTLREKSEMHEKVKEAEEACRRALGIFDLLAVEQPDE